ELGIDAGRATGRPIQLANQAKLLVERHDTKGERLVGEPLRIGGAPGAGSSPLDDAEGQQFLEVEIDHVVAAVRAPALGKLRRDIGDIVEMKIVEHDEMAVAGRDDVLLEVVRTLPVC